MGYSVTRKSKITIILTIICVITGMVVFDYVRSLMFHIEVVSISPTPVVADGETPVSVVLKLTNHKGEPVEGHNLFALPTNGGSLKANRVVTDTEGLAEYTYYPYRLTNLIKLENVNVDVKDESNSVFIEIGAKTSFIIPLIEPEAQEDVDINYDSIFGE